MDLSFTEEQEALKNDAREFLAQRSPNAEVRRLEDDPPGYSPELWQAMAEKRWVGMILPPSYGEQGASFLDLCCVYEEMGRQLTPGPFLDVILAEYLLLDLGSEEQKRACLPLLGTGQTIMSVAYTEPSASYAPGEITLSATADDGQFVLNGTKLFVTNAHIANHLLVVARTRRGVDPSDGLSVFLVPREQPGLTVNVLKTLSSDRQCELTFDNVRVATSSLVGPLHDAWPAVRRYLDRSRVLTCVWSVGGAEYVVEMSAEYAKNRVQFGKPIGAFQAIAHKCADQAIAADGMRFVVYRAAWLVSEGLPADTEISIAKAWTADNYRRIAELGHHVYGGLGFMKEKDIQMYYRRAKAAEVAFGDADCHRQLVADGLGL